LVKSAEISLTKIFISYAREDGGSIALKVKNYLENLKYEVFLDKVKIIGGERWNEKLRKSIISCDILIVIITPAALRSEWVGKEVKEATNRGRYIIPIRQNTARNYPLEWGLDRLQIIDYQIDDEEDYSRLYTKISESIIAYAKDPEVSDTLKRRLEHKKRLRLSIYCTLAVVTLVAVVLFFYLNPQQIVSYQFLKSWGTKGEPFTKFNSPLSLTTDPAGNIYVADKDNNRIQKFTSNGTHITSWGEEGRENGQFKSPFAIATDSTGNVYVADTGNNRIQKFTSNGTYVTSWRVGVSQDIAIDSSANVYVADTGNNRIQKFTSNGTYITSWGEGGSKYGQFNSPSGVATDSTGNVYVADTGNNRIQKFTSNGTLFKVWQLSYKGTAVYAIPVSIAVDSSNNIYIGDILNNRIQEFSSNGTYLKSYGTRGYQSGQFNSLFGISIDSSTNVYVADMGNNRIQKLSLDESPNSRFEPFIPSTSESTILGPTYHDIQFNTPYAVNLDSSGNIYVADTGNDRIQKFSSDGIYLTSWGEIGSANGQFLSPSGIALDSADNVYVADTGNDRIQKFSSDGTVKSITKGLKNKMFDSPLGIGIDSSSNEIFVADSNNHLIKRFSLDLTYFGSLGGQGTNGGRFSFPIGVAVSKSGNLSGYVYVADSGNNRIAELQKIVTNKYIFETIFDNIQDNFKHYFH